VPDSSLYPGSDVSRVVLAVFVAAFVADLLAKAWATSSVGVVYNPRPTELPIRVLLSLVAVAVVFALERLALLRGLGRQWGLWIGCASLLAGTFANGVSPLIWHRGVPDFIGVGDGWFWNVADFEIAVGLTAGILSVGVSALLAYLREQAVRPRGLRAGVP
jgi:Signal peptidase (SPase) II